MVHIARVVERDDEAGVEEDQPVSRPVA
jgi:hypothetical protein